MNRDWYQIVPGDGMWAVVDPKDPQYVWSTSTNTDTGQVFLWDARTTQALDVSPDAENNGVRSAGDVRYRFNWDTPIAFTNDGKALVGGNVVFESADRGQTWSVISPDLTRNDASKQGPSGGPISHDQSGAEFYDTILYLATTKLDNGIIWAATDDGLVQLSRDGGAHWQNVSPPESLVPPWGRVMGLDPGRFAAGTAFVAIERHLLGDDRPYVLRTDDYGTTWRSIAGNLPANVSVRSIRQDPRNANLLYAGTSRGVWMTLDGGTDWQGLRLNMPASTIYDLEIQPDADDLVVGAHGRGVWILDDLTPLQDWASAASSEVTFFAPRDAYRMWQWPPVNTFTDPKIPPNEYTGANPPYGAIFTYYLPRAPNNASITIRDASGRAVRHLTGNDVAKGVGMNRAAWDLNEDGPAKWKGTFEDNQGPDTGPEAVPGVYAVDLTVDGITRSQPLTVRVDPRDPSPATYRARYQFLVPLYGALSTVDSMLNAIDTRLKTATPAQAAPLKAFRLRLTYDPRNIEDLSGPAQIRENLLDLIGRMGNSFQAPTAAQREAAAAYRTEVEQLQTAYRQL
jgi:photosystem II stability/assembly factor-like uncharacterized protein